MFLNQQALTAEDFLRDYWQKRPLVLRQALPGFVPELDANDIAGLACDEMAESRLITGSFERQDWTLRYGPFSEADFNALPARHWTLLVQDVEKHYPPLQALLSAFAFLPNWRIDDLMASVAAPGGSVGPHVDQYDVFLLQASGRRRWQISESYDATLLPDCELNVLRSFEAEQSWDLGPGDVLYLPPGVAHHGVALGPEQDGRGQDRVGVACMTWSIGMRAPSAADLLQALGEWLAAAADEGGRYRDPEPMLPARHGEIDQRAIDRMRSLLHDALDDPEGFPAFLGAFLARYRLAHEPAPPPRQLSPAQVQEQLRRGAALRHNPWTRLNWIADEQGACLSAPGSSHRCSHELAELLCHPEALASAPLGSLDAESEVLCELINRGHLFLESL
jgi:50S ribosomal protein L16 3-hydroxylase